MNEKTPYWIITTSSLPVWGACCFVVCQLKIAGKLLFTDRDGKMNGGDSVKVNVDQAYDQYCDSLRIGARPIYAQEAIRFLAYVDGELTRENVLSYIGWLQKEGYAAGTIVKITLPVIRKIFRLNNEIWPLRRGEGPTIKEGDTYAPALNPEVVEKLILASRLPGTKRMDRALLALSTVYGLRRVEMAQITKKEIDLKNRVLLIRTAKGGRERWHTIPEQIVDVLRIKWIDRTPANVSSTYLRLEKAAKIERMTELGFHSIRRILVRELVEANLPAYVIDNFLRWKRSGGDMQRVYYGSTVVGIGDKRVELGKLDRETDEAVFKVHPFLNLWR